MGYSVQISLLYDRFFVIKKSNCEHTFGTSPCTSLFLLIDIGKVFKTLLSISYKHFKAYFASPFFFFFNFTLETVLTTEEGYEITAVLVSVQGGCQTSLLKTVLTLFIVCIIAYMNSCIK